MILKNDMYIYHTGLAIETDKHYGIFLFLRSSNRKTDAYLCNHVGISDSAIYRGEIMLCFKNRTSFNDRIEIEKSKQFFNLLKNSSIHSDISTIFESVFEAEEKANEIYNNPMDYAPYKVGDKIAQMVVLPYPNVKIIELENLSETERGSNGFGSTGN